MKLSTFIFSASLAVIHGLSALSSAHADQLMQIVGGGSQLPPKAALEVELKEPFGVEFDSKGQMWIVEMVSGNRLLKVDGNGLVHHLAGQLTPGDSGVDGPGLQAQFNGPHNLAIGKNDEVFIGDTWNKKIKIFTPETGKVTLLESYEKELDAHRGAGPFCITLNADKTQLYIANLRTVWKIDLTSGKATLIAGNGQKGIPQDGAVAKDSPLRDPRAVAADSKGNVYILERDGHALRVVAPDGTIKTVINSSGEKGLSQDGELGIHAKMNGPKHLCIDADDSVLIADAENHVIIRYNPVDQKVYRIAGTGKKGSEGVPGDPKRAQLARPHGVTIHPVTKELIITDSYNNRILKIAKD